MDFSKDSLAFWATNAGTLVSLLGLLQSNTWLTGIGAALLLIAGFALVYARRQNQRLRAAAVQVEGRSVDSLNIASLQRTINRTLMVQEVEHAAEIDGENLVISLECAGYCRATSASSIEFSLDTDNNFPFAELECFAYDLRHDPKRKHKIRPVLVGSDGISKKVAVPFLEPLATGQPFRSVLTCKLPACMKSGVEYYTSTLSFEQDVVCRYRTRLTFVGTRPLWLRVYECDDSGNVRLLRGLPPLREEREITEYLDSAENVPARLARIYAFARPTMAAATSTSSSPLLSSPSVK